MKTRSYTIKIAIFIFGIFLFSACKKNDGVIKQNDGYQIKSSAIPPTTGPNEILVAPFPNLGPTGNFLSGFLVKTDYVGNTFTQKTFNASVFNFRRWTIDGTIVYSYCLFDPNPVPPLLGFLAGTIYVTDANLNPIQSIRLLGHPGHDDRLDGHDFILLNSTDYIVETYYTKKVTNIPDSVPHSANCTVAAPLIQEVHNGQVVFEWDASNFPEFYAASVEGNDFTNTTATQDYMHLNSIFVDPKDNNLVVSFRQTDQIIKINRTTGAIMWRLGGKKSDFPITAAQEFLRQHDATITSSGALLLVDNGLAVVRPYSRISEFVLDEANKTITSFRTINLPASTPFIQYMGSVQRTNNVYFIGGGTLPYNFEMDVNTGYIYSAEFLPSNSYRAFKY